jgi:hypothetical protein
MKGTKHLGVTIIFILLARMGIYVYKLKRTWLLAVPDVLRDWLEITMSWPLAHPQLTPQPLRIICCVASLRQPNPASSKNFACSRLLIVIS